MKKASRVKLFDHFGQRLKLVKKPIQFLLIAFMSLLSGLSLAQDINGDATACLGSQHTYTVADNPGVSYSWNVSGGTIVSTAPSGNEISVVWSSQGSGTVSIAGMPGNLSDAMTVQVSALPTPEILTLESLYCGQPSKEKLATQLDCYKTCENATDVYVTALHPGSTYTWAVTGQANMTVNNNEISITWGPSGTGTIQVTETNAAGCETTVSVCVQILEGPTALFTTIPMAVGNVVTICLGQTVYFTDASTGAQNWTWDFGDGSSSSSQNPDHTYTHAGTYTVTLTVGNGSDPSGVVKGTKGEVISSDLASQDPRQQVVIPGTCNCTDTYQMTIVVEEKPAPVIECISTVCANETQTYSTTAVCSNYSWSVSGGTILSSSGNTVEVQWGDGSTGPGYLTLDVGACAGYCDNPTTVQVPIIPTTATISGPATVCNFAYETYSVPLMPGTSYTWTIGSGFGTIVSGQGTHQVVVYWNTSANPTTTVNVSYYNSVLECGGTGTKNVEVVPQFRITGINALCGGTVNPQNALNSYILLTGAPVLSNWSVTTPSGTVLSNLQTNSSVFNTYSYNAGPGTYIVTAVPSSGNFCNSSESHSVTVYDKTPMPLGITGVTSICPGATETYIAQSSISNPIFTWNVIGGTVNISNGSTITVTWDAAGPYSVGLIQDYAQASGCQSDEYVLTVNSKLPVTAPAISGVTSICLGGTSTYSFVSNNPEATYLWTISPANLGNIITVNNSTSMDVVWSDNNQNTTTADVVLTASLCGQSASTTLTVNLEGFTPNMTISNPICVGSPASFTGTAGIDYEWSFGDGATATVQSPTHAYATAGSYPVTFFVRNANNCEATISQVIDVHPSPIANISTPDRLDWCSDETVSVTFYAVEGSGDGSPYSYAWSNGNTGNPTTVTTPGTYFTVVTDQYGCSKNSDTIIVLQHSCEGGGCQTIPVNAAFTAVNNGCNVVDFAPTSLTDYRVISWYFNDIQSGANNVSNLVNASHTFTEAGYYWVRMNYRAPNINGVPGDSADCYVEQQVFIPVVADFTSTFSCNGNNQLATNLIDQSGFITPEVITSWNWDIDGSIYAPTQNFTTVLPSGSHTVTLTVTSSTTTCAITKNIMVPVMPTAVMDFTAGVCPGELVTFHDLSTGDSLSSRYWDFGPGVASSAVQNPTRIFNDPGSVAITLTVSNIYGCTDTATDTLIVSNPENNPILANGSTTFCAGGSVELVAPAGSNYLWSSGETTQSIFATEAGNYTVQVQGTNGCTYTTSPTAIFILTAPVATITGDHEICQGTGTVLTAPFGGQVYTWAYDALPIDNNYIYYTTTFYPSVFVSNPGNYQVTIQTAQGCTSVSDAFTLNVVARPIQPVLSIVPSGSPICSDVTHTISVTNPEVGVTYQWNTGQTGQSIVVSDAGAYFATAINSSGCTTNSSGLLVNQAPDLSTVMTGCYEFCKSELPVFIPAPAGYAYSWFEITGGSFTLISQDQQLKVDHEGQYVLTLTSPFGCKVTSDPFQVSLLPDPQLTVTSNPQVVCIGQETTLTVSGADSYSWCVNDAFGCTPLGSYNPITVEPTENTFYTVTGTDSETGCSAQYTHEVKVYDCTNTGTQFCTLTQGFYGNGKGKSCATGEKGSVLMLRVLSSPFGPLVIGKPGRSLTITSANVNCIISRLPAGGTPTLLPLGNQGFGANCSTTIPLISGKFNNVLLGQTITLGLNLRMNTVLGSFILSSSFTTVAGTAGSDNFCGTPDDVQIAGSNITKNIPSSVITALVNIYGSATVADLFDLANRALGGQYTGGATLPEINQAVDAINVGFDGCRTLVNTSTTNYTINNHFDENNSQVNGYKAEIYPNPFDQSFTVKYDFKASEKLELVVCDLFGKVIYEVKLDAKRNSHEVDLTNMANGMYLVHIKLNDEIQETNRVVKNK